MKPSASRIERMLAKVEARLVPPPRKFLSAIIDDIDDEATVKKKKRRRSPSMWPAILKMSAARLRTSTGYCTRSSEASFLKGEHLARK